MGVGVLLAALLAAGVAVDRHGRAADDAKDQEEDDSAEASVSLPTDRLKERQLDRARRLIADERWSDAATLLDEMLAGDRDFFFRPQQGEATWRSIKTEAAILVGTLPPAGREAYDLQFRARADRLLEQAIAAGDVAGVVAVARRWFHTPAGRRATLVAALEALEADQPLAAAVWLERLAAGRGDEFEPTLSVMRAVAWWRAGDRRAAESVLEGVRRRQGSTVRIGGRDVALAIGDGRAGEWLAAVAGAGSAVVERQDAEWRQVRGDAARNALVEASRPLLVPRYRVPLTRHPDEARLLEKRRRMYADRDAPLLPAGTPLAVDGSIVLHSPLGLLAVDFATGKRIWIRGSGILDAGPVSEGDDGDGADGAAADGLQRVFSDATAGGVSSNGRLVYAVERQVRERRGTPRGVGSTGPDQGNVLAAYDIAARGAPAWRRPASGDGDADGVAWYLGAPLTIGDQLFVLVEEKGEIRLDVLEAADGRLVWSQPLAELDEEQQADRPETVARRSAALSPAFSDGMLVCPTGAGTAVAVDLATRTLLWAYNYPVSRGADEAGRLGVRGPFGGMVRRVIVNGVPIGEAPAGPEGWRDACPIVASGRVLLTPVESGALHCVDLRTGALKWSVPRGEAMYVAGVVDDRVYVVGSHGVECRALENGQSGWSKPLAFGPASVSGRGILTPRRLFVPLDTPEVVEIDLAAGTIAGRSPSRGGVIPGNLLAYRGEVISQGLDSLDVFHQVAPLEGRIETAERERQGDSWVSLWRGQIDLDAGRVSQGLRSIAAARRADPGRISADVVADALLFGMRRDFAAAAPLWQEIATIAGPLPRSKALLGVAFDNQLAAGAVAEAWQSLKALLDMPPSGPGDDDWLSDDLADPTLVVSEPRWIQGRVRDLLGKAPPAVRREIDAFVDAALLDAGRIEEGDAVTALEALAVRFASHPAGATARQALLEAIDARLQGSSREAGRTLAVRRDLLLLAEGRLDAGNAELAAGGPWPFGRVGVHRGGRSAKPEDALRSVRTLPIPLDSRSRSGVSGLQIGCEIQSQSLIFTDGLGRRIGEPVAIDSRRSGMINQLLQPLNTEATALGPLVLVRSGGVFAAFDVRAGGGTNPERLWVASEMPMTQAELPAFGIQIGRAGRWVKRNGPIALGMRVSEPEIPGATQPVRAMLVIPSGVAILRDQTLEFRDPASGAVLWRRHRLPATGELVGDDEFLCVCPRDGRRAMVLATADGRLVGTRTLPPHDQRLMAAGRRIATLSGQGNAAAATVECIDVGRDERVKLGDFSAAARAERAGPGLLAILEPEGALTVIDIELGTVRFRTTLPAMPPGLEHLHVIPWQDRLLVHAVRRETAQEQQQLDKFGNATPLPQMAPSIDGGDVVGTGSIWAVSRDTGESLWPVPATVVRQCLHRHQPAELPVLVFARHLHSRRDGNLTRLDLLVLDKRTGHAVYMDDRIPVQQHTISGCDVSGDPERHTVTLGRAGGDAVEIRLDFTGQPMAPRPPYQAAMRPTGGGDLFSELESWLQKAITIPLPF